MLVSIVRVSVEEEERERWLRVVGVVVKGRRRVVRGLDLVRW